MKKLNICFVGIGWMGETQLRTLTNIGGVSFPVVVERNKERASEVLGKLGLKDTVITDDYDYALENFKIDIVWLVSPNSFHAPQSIKAMKKGIHVFCEKPASTTFKDFEDEISLEESNPGIKTLVDYILAFNPMEQALFKMIGDGQLGTIEQIQVNYRHPINISGDKKWKLDKSIMGDALGMGINHAISVIVHAMSTQSKPVAVYATSKNFGVRGFGPDTVYNIMIRYENGATALCLGNIDNDNGYDLYHCIAGTKGGMIFDSRVELEDKVRLWGENLTDGKWVYPLREGFHSENEYLKPFKPDMMLPDSGNVLDHQVHAALEHFLSCVRDDVKSNLSFVNSRLIAEIGWAAQISAKTHREVTLPISEEDRQIALTL